jgi:hypothetical protein
MTSHEPLQLHCADPEDAPWWSSLLVALVLVVAAASAVILIQPAP